MDRPYDLTDEEREALRADGYKPVEIWVPDLDDPTVRERWRAGARRVAETDRREGMDEMLGDMLDDFMEEE